MKNKELKKIIKKKNFTNIEYITGSFLIITGIGILIFIYLILWSIKNPEPPKPNYRIQQGSGFWLQYVDIIEYKQTSPNCVSYEDPEWKNEKIICGDYSIFKLK